ncbi:hypothetical protein CONLIGDRAFT_373537 [Coniochaeta ligniaria NRRL 30616]|uniref:Uncharacterized protein n=1 Tax=Coniochaeta ligniaria NRRL 30616 TaxID=1408157 RepID=A0A1J7IL95_9PEZI|nr:hypothetical protein CONLIGDRAFT_373537 [Coniochaeta ligniaria NRRL 30616]
MKQASTWSSGRISSRLRQLRPEPSSMSKQMFRMIHIVFVHAGLCQYIPSSWIYKLPYWPVCCWRRQKTPSQLLHIHSCMSIQLCYLECWSVTMIVDPRDITE